MDSIFDTIDDEDRVDTKSEDYLAIREALTDLYDLSVEDADCIIVTHGDDVLPLRGNVCEVARRLLARSREWGDCDDFEGIV